jgi:hypothetical protein
MKTITVTELEFEHFKVTLEGAIEEINDLMTEHDYYVTELSDRLQECLHIIEGAK